MEYTEVTLLVAKCVGTENVMGWKNCSNFGLTGHLKTKTTNKTGLKYKRGYNTVVTVTNKIKNKGQSKQKLKNRKMW